MTRWNELNLLILGAELCQDCHSSEYFEIKQCASGVGQVWDSPSNKAYDESRGYLLRAHRGTTLMISSRSRLAISVYGNLVQAVPWIANTDACENK